MMSTMEGCREVIDMSGASCALDARCQGTQLETEGWGGAVCLKDEAPRGSDDGGVRGGQERTRCCCSKCATEMVAVSGWGRGVQAWGLITAPKCPLPGRDL